MLIETKSIYAYWKNLCLLKLSRYMLIGRISMLVETNSIYAYWKYLYA